jgi:phosphoglycolate phosphatase-like HAD superfamily hydrolase
MVKLVLFDIDGTLIQTGGAGEKAFSRVCEMEFGVPRATEFLQFAGRTDPSIVRDFFTRASIPPTPENFRRFFESYVFLLDELLRQLDGQVLRGVFPLLNKLESLPHQPLIGLLTGNIRLGAQIKLTHYNLWDRFSLGGFGDDHEDRNQIAAIARQRGHQRLARALDGDEILVIGDTPRDIECARAIGARVLAVATGKFSVDELRRERPDWATASLDDFNVDKL